MDDDFKIIQKLVGDVSPDQLRYIDCFVGEDMAFFMPQGGACFYALTPLHSHPGYMFVYNFDDRTGIRLNETTITAIPGKLLALSPGIMHNELPSEMPPRYIAVLIDRDFFESQLAEYQPDREIIFNAEFYDVPKKFLTLLKEFMIEATTNSPGRDAILRAMSVEISHQIIRSALELSPATKPNDFRLEIGRVTEYIHANLGQKLKIEDMASIACMSPSHFSHVFKEETGATPIEYLNQVRFKRAKRLLLASDKTLTEIALECGFCSSAYFSDRFSKEFKMTPSNYKKSMISKNNNKISKE